MVRIILISFVSLILMSCSDYEESKSMDFGPFSIDLPNGWTKLEMQGIDSYVGGITNGSDSLFFDYGWYSYDFKHTDEESHLFTLDTINGKIATLVKPKIKGQGTIGIYIESAQDKNHFNLIGSDIENEELIFSIFKSIRFMDSDTTMNSKNFGQDFGLISSPSKAKKLFKTNCASCHKTSEKFSTGPGFKSITGERFEQWFFDSTFVYIPKPPNENMGSEYHRKIFGFFTSEQLRTMRILLKN